MVSQKYYHFLILTLIGTAIGIRLYGIDHGFPTLVTGDERPVCKNVVGFLVNHSLEPEHFNYPEFILIYLEVTLPLLLAWRNVAIGSCR